MQRAKWLIKNIRTDYGKLAEALAMDEALCRCIVNRGNHSMEEIAAYLHPDPAGLHDPDTMKDLPKAGALLLQAMGEKRKIRLIGDYDIDGTMSVYIGLVALRRLGATVDYAIPHRITDGYGINAEMVEQAKEDGVELLVTFDNGIAAMEAVARAKALGIPIIVTDHHDVPFLQEGGTRREVLPPADAVVNPKRGDCDYPFKLLCGAGVAFKLVSWLYDRAGLPKEELDALLPFVAMATVGDIVDLTGENRILVTLGLEAMKTLKNDGLEALARLANVDLGALSPYAIGFILGPCFNAAGRLSTARDTVELLFATGGEALHLAEELYRLNQERRAMTEEGVVLAEERIEAEGSYDDDILLVHLSDVHESLAGIIAGRIKEKYHRPTIVLTTTEEGLKGSARSIEAYNLFEGLYAVKHHLKKFGGHPMAAGLTMEAASLEDLREELNLASTLTEEDLMPKITIDARVHPGRIDGRFLAQLKMLEPFGKGNPRPVFAEKGFEIQSILLMGQEKNHVKLRLVKDGKPFEGVYFFGAAKLSEMLEEEGAPAQNLPGALKGRRCDLLFYPELNRYNGMESIQLKIQDFRFSGN